MFHSGIWRRQIDGHGYPLWMNLDNEADLEAG